MSIEQTLFARCDNKCELCASESHLNIFDVPPANEPRADKSIMICDTCFGQLTDSDTCDTNHWRCLNDSMWSQVPAVQVIAWRQLKHLTEKGEDWTNDLVEMMYMEPDVQEWAAALEEEVDDSEPTLDSNGVRLAAGDSVVLIKDLDVKGANFTAKRGTPVRNIGLTSNPEHIEGRVNGQRIVILSCYVKK
jgi:protein PhnA